MKYVLMFVSDPTLDAALDEEAGAALYREIYQWFGTHGEHLEGGAELQPPSTATTLRGAADGPLVVDGPFSEAKEVIGGFTLLEAPDLDAALAIAKTWPSLRLPGNSVEVRPMVEDYSQFE